MKFLFDESAKARLATYLREQGHDVTTIAQDYQNALEDRKVLELAFKEQRILVADDKDFGELVFRYQQRHAGIILFRLGIRDFETRRVWLDYLLTHHAQDFRHFLVITEHGVRVRKKEE